MATLRQSSTSESDLSEVRYAEKSNLPVNGSSGCTGAFIGPETQNLSLPILRYFDNEALMAYVELMHNLVERLGEKVANREDFSEISEEDLTRRKDHKMRERSQTDVPQKVQKQPVAYEKTLLKNGSNNLKKDSKAHREEWKNQEILHWINKKLNANYCALGEVKDGKGLNALIGKVLEYEYSESSLQSWQNIEDVLLMHDMETHIPLDELKCCNEDALRKMIKWLRDMEAKRSP